MRTAEHNRKISESLKGHALSVKTKRKISESLKGHALSAETKLKISLIKKANPTRYWKGKHLSQQHRQSISTTLLGHPGTKHTEESKQKLSQYNMGKKQSEATKQKRSQSLMGHTVSAEARAKSSAAQKGKLTGFASIHWRGGKSFEPYPITFNRVLKERIKERDNHQCQNPDCWGKGSKLSVHHINYDKANCSGENLITVCRSCNSRANANRPYWTNLYSNLLGVVV